MIGTLLTIFIVLCIVGLAFGLFSKASLGGNPTNSANLLLGVWHKNQFMAINTVGLLRTIMSTPLIGHIRKILFLRANKQMIGIDATWHVALMAYIHATRYWPAELFVGDAGGYLGTASNANFPVPLMVKAAGKKEAPNFRNWHGVMEKPFVRT